MQAAQLNNTANNAAITSLLDRALSLDPDFAAAHSLYSLIYSNELVNSSGSDASGSREEFERLAIESATKALSLNSNDSLAFDVLGQVHAFGWRWSEADAVFDRSIEVGSTGGLAAWFNAYLGRREKALQIGERATALDPANSVDRTP